MGVKLVNGEHDFRKPACLEYCYIDPEFCPLYKLAVGGSGNTVPASLSIQRWCDLQTGTSYEVDYSRKLSPSDQLPKLTPDDTSMPESPELEDTSDIPDYDEKIQNEHDEFTPFSCWGDGSGFERDIMPDNLVGPSGSMEHLYDLSYYPINTTALQLSDWNTWVDKFQTDYRFGQVSDLNAETVLFPNVDTPWMFTEYIFQGTGTGEIIVEPPLYDEDTLELCNADKLLEVDENSEDENDQAILLKYSDKVTTTIEGESKTFVKSYRKVCDWDELNAKEDRRHIGRYGSKDSGGKLYRVDVPVQSVKWGEHGNIPPNTLNMAAPKDWMDITKTAAKIKPTYIAHIGIPYYASSYGVVYWKDRDAWIDPISAMTDYDYDNEGRIYLRYNVDLSWQDGNGDPPGVKQNTPRNAVGNSSTKTNSSRLVSTYLPTGSISHGGCQMLKGELNTDNTGKCYCEALQSLNLTDPNYNSIVNNFQWGLCSTSNSSCPYFVTGLEYPILADFETAAYSASEYNSAVLGVYSGDNVTQRIWADSMLSGTFGLQSSAYSMGRDDIYNQTEVSVWYEAQFEVVYEASNPVQLSKQMTSSDSFGRGIEVIRGTGKFALDTYENSNAFRGDTVFFDDWDQLGFSRWLATPMFCAKSAYCNDTCGYAMNGGWDPDERAGSSDGGCKYYRSSVIGGASGHHGCPYTCVQKRAYEFQQTMVTASSLIMSLARMWLVMTDIERDEYNKLYSNTYYFESDNTTLRDDSSDTSEGVWKLWSKSDDAITVSGGVYIKDTSTLTETRYVTNSRGEEVAEQIETTIRLIGKIRCEAGTTDGFFWYQSLDNDGSAKEVWFCKCDEDYIQFTRNTLIITNEDKFIGGYHPQYKDYSKMGPEFIMEVESDSYRDAMGDIIGDVDYDGQPQATNNEGYWTDASGDYVVDETDTGIDVAIATDDSRKNASSPTTISIKKSNTTVDTEAGTNTAPKTVNCAVHSNDPYDLIENVFREVHYDPPDYNRTGRPMFDSDDGTSQYWAPPNVQNGFALPTMRLAAHCETCGYYLSWRFHDLLCPWCGNRLTRIYGHKGEGMDAGDTWAESYPNAKLLRKFFKLNAIGKAQVWAPPGTCIPLDGYYWKNPSVVTSALVRQIKYRLGEYKDNAWQGGTMTAQKEFTLGYPERMGYYISTPAYSSDEDDAGEVYDTITWTGVSAQDRSRYASYNDIMSYNPLPGLATDTMNESVIAPYTDASDDALKVISLAELIALRNRIEPVIAYTSDLPEAGDYPRYRASYENRLSADVPRYIRKGSCRVPSVVLGSNDNGIDSYVQFWSGDYEWGTVREYYPPGLSWWWLNDLIGGKYSDLTGGYYHMDGDSPHSGGNRTVAKCAIFLHGILPLDKEILAAYVVIYPAGEPSKDPIGRGWNGIIHYDHYHALTQDHKGDGAEKHLHGQAGFDTGFDEDGNYIYSEAPGRPWSNAVNPIIPQDTSDYYGWAKSSERPADYISIFQSNFLSDWTGLCGVRDEGFWKQYGTDKVNLNNSSDPIYGYDGDLNTGLTYNSRLSSTAKASEKFQYIGVDEDGNLRQLVETDEIWQELTQAEMQALIDRNLIDVEFSWSTGNTETDIIYSFQQYTDAFLNSTLPEQMQSIPGYIDMTGTNTSNRMSSIIEMVTKSTSSVGDKPVIVQDTEGNTTDTNYSGSSESSQSGIVARVFDVTSSVQSEYNNRIDRKFYCQAGKTLEEVSEIEFEDPTWQGVGTWKDEAASKKWNSQERDGEFSGYWLNDDYSFPLLEDDRTIPASANDGEQYELAPTTIQILCTILVPFTIKAENNQYWIITTTNATEEDEPEIQTIPTGRVTSIEEAVSILQSMFGAKFTVTATSDSSVLIVGDEDIVAVDIKECTGSCYGYFSLSTGAVASSQNRIYTVTDYESGYDPSGLASGRAWVANSYIYQTQKTVFDLARAPLEDYERDYRYVAPSLDCSNCYCPNTDCSSAGRTVGTYAQMKGLSFSVGQTRCPACGTDLSGEDGAVTNAGDGLYSYYYQDAFEPDPFITGFHIEVMENMGFRVSCRMQESDTWRPLLSATYDSQTERYTYYFADQTYDNVASLPTDFSLPQKNWIRGRYIQIECDPIEGTDLIEFKEVERVGDYTARVKGNFQDYGLFDWAGLAVGVNQSMEFVDNSDDSNSEDSESSSEEPTEITTYILSSVNLNDSYTEMTLYFKQILPETIDLISIKPKIYITRIAKFKVYGFHYTSDNLTMTGGATEKLLLFSIKGTKYQLDEFPTQILSVTIGKTDSGGIILTESDSKDNLYYELTTKTIKTIGDDGKYQDLTCYAISSGNYYFDPNHNRVILPAIGITTNGHEIELAHFEDDLAGLKENVTYYPSVVSIRYWSGAGLPITLDASAEGLGPSYQVEKDTITQIETTLPDNGTSVRMPDMAGTLAKRKIPWVCYNHIPATLAYATQTLTGGYFSIPSLETTALGTTVDNDQYFINLFGDNLKSITGRCTTELTFYGAPDQIISGTIWVTAPAYTTKTIDTGNGTVTWRERTGGIANGCFICKVPVSSCKGRKSLAWSKPTLIIYAKDRNPTDSF